MELMILNIYIRLNNGANRVFVKTVFIQIQPLRCQNRDVELFMKANI